MSGRCAVDGAVHVDIGEARLDGDADISLAQAYASLDEAERVRAGRFLFERDRDRFVRAHGFLRRRLGAFLGIQPKTVAIAGREGEKPVVEGATARFSLSHSGAHAVIAITRDEDVGIDLEAMDRGLDDQMDGLARLCLTEAEQDALWALPHETRVPRFLAFWTAKEARMKLTGEGMSLEPTAIALKLVDGRPVGYLRPRAPAANLRFIPLAAPNLICCLAVGAGQQVSIGDRQGLR